MNSTHKSYLPLIAVIALAAIFYFSVIVVLVFNIQAPLTPSSSASGKTPTVNILLYEGEIPNSSLYGFGTSPNNLTSPGPTLRFTTSDVVNITVVNVGNMPHAFEITDAPATDAKVLFNAKIGSAANPLQHEQQGTVIFIPNEAGASYYYICPVPGHVSLGMYGSVVITAG
ncbi:MAG: plastocyanin/azurin family copper-binding protein [Candidatus Bathyarchaeia archaeon]